MLLKHIVIPLPTTYCKEVTQARLILISDSSEHVVIIELIVPSEDCIKEAHEWKKAKYLELSEERRRNRWKARCESIEFGYRGFVGQPLHCSLRLLGVRGLHERRATKNITDTSEKVSRWLLMKKGDPWCSAPLGHKSGTDHPRLYRPGGGVWWSRTRNTLWLWIHHWWCVQVAPHGVWKTNFFTVK